MNCSDTKTKKLKFRISGNFHKSLLCVKLTYKRNLKRLLQNILSDLEKFEFLQFVNFYNHRFRYFLVFSLESQDFNTN